MRFGISNLIWPHLSVTTRQRLQTLCAVCDFAPTVHFGGWLAVPPLLPKRPYGDNAMEIGALQSLFFGMAEASLVKGDREFAILREHFQHLVRWASSIDVPYLIFGSPGTRSGLLVDLDGPVLAKRVRQLADDAQLGGVRLCFEVNSPKFGCEFLSSNEALFGLLDQMQHPGLGLHLDVGQMVEEGLEPATVVEQHAAALLHIHLSAPDFSCRPEMLPLYRDIMRVVKRCADHVDVVLEVQKLGQASETDLLLLSEALVQES